METLLKYLLTAVALILLLIVLNGIVWIFIGLASLIKGGSNKKSTPSAAPVDTHASADSPSKPPSIGRFSWLKRQPPWRYGVVAILATLAILNVIYRVPLSWLLLALLKWSPVIIGLFLLPGFVFSRLADRIWFVLRIMENASIILTKNGQFWRNFVRVTSDEQFQRFTKLFRKLNMDWLKNQGLVSRDLRGKDATDAALKQYRRQLPFRIVQGGGFVFIGPPWLYKIHRIPEVELSDLAVESEAGGRITQTLQQISVFIPKEAKKTEEQQRQAEEKGPGFKRTIKLFFANVASGDGIETALSYSFLVRVVNTYNHAFAVKFWLKVLINQITTPLFSEAVSSTRWDVQEESIKDLQNTGKSRRNKAAERASKSNRGLFIATINEKVAKGLADPEVQAKLASWGLEVQLPKVEDVDAPQLTKALQAIKEAELAAQASIATATGDSESNKIKAIGERAKASAPGLGQADAIKAIKEQVGDGRLAGQISTATQVFGPGSGTTKVILGGSNLASGAAVVSEVLNLVGGDKKSPVPEVKPSEPTEKGSEKS
jgi:hypothetical protein